MKIGAQFFTVRDFCKNLNGLSESLKKVADIGYKTVQISGVCDYEPQWLRDELAKNGLKCVLTHKPLAVLKDSKKVCEDHRIFGCKNIGLGWYGYSGENPDDNYPRFKEIFTPIAKGIKENGGYFMYHNHDQEFIKLDGKAILHHIAEDFAPDELGFTLDTFWIQAGGANPAEYVEQFAGRIPCIHLKDYAYGRKMAVVGEGNINFDKVIAAAEKSAVEYLLVEQDDCYGENPFDCLKRSYDYLKAMGLE